MHDAKQPTGSSTDTLSPEERSERMGRVRNKDTKPEMKVRRLVHSMGYRYRLHSGGLPGRPDIVFPERRKIIFVHGCYWHRHEGCSRCRLPKSRLDFWAPKLEKNRLRDIENQVKLKELGWDVLVVWECEVEEAAGLPGRIMNFLEDF
ncbi:very short patch repair endonuclease [soil metagenome]